VVPSVDPSSTITTSATPGWRMVRSIASRRSPPREARDHDAGARIARRRYTEARDDVFDDAEAAQHGKARPDDVDERREQWDTGRERQPPPALDDVVSTELEQIDQVEAAGEVPFDVGRPRAEHVSQVDERRPEGIVAGDDKLRERVEQRADRVEDHVDVGEVLDQVVEDHPVDRLERGQRISGGHVQLQLGVPRTCHVDHARAHIDADPSAGTEPREELAGGAPDLQDRRSRRDHRADESVPFGMVEAPGPFVVVPTLRDAVEMGDDLPREVVREFLRRDELLDAAE
jgi:hypothetical protein